MLNLKKSLKLAGVLAIALGAAVPAMTSTASAAPITRHEIVRVAQNDRGGFEHRDFEHRDFRHGGKKECHHGFRHEFKRDR